MQRILVAALVVGAALVLAAGDAFHTPTHDLAVTPAGVTVFGANGGDSLGIAIAGGDFNGDTIDDLLLGAYNVDVGLAGDAGAAYVVFGDAALAGNIDMATPSPDLTVLGGDFADWLGVSAATGDFNGDTVDDLLLGAKFGDAASNAKLDAGEAYVIFGSASLGGTIDIAASEQDLTVLGADSQDNMGTAVAAGDFNADGIDDLLLGALFADGAGNTRGNAGEAHVIFGSLTLGGTINLATTSANVTVIGGGNGDNLGTSVAGGDFDGDGTDDVLVGATLADGAANGRTNSGESYVILGSATLSGTKDMAASDQDLTVFGIDAFDQLGRSGAGGDFNGDGIDDLLLGANLAAAAGNAKPQAGEAYVVLGDAALGGTIDLAASPPDLAVLGADTADQLGDSLAGADFNGDGIDDLLLGASQADAAANAKSAAGEAYVIFGEAALSGTHDLFSTSADLTVLGADVQDLLGLSVATGDFNTDAIDDVLLGAPFADADANAKGQAGEAYVLFGVCPASSDPDSDGLCNSQDPDDDNDGFSDAAEAFLTTDPLKACSLTATTNDEDPDPWPVDFDDNQIVNILDVIPVLPPYFGSASGDPDYSQRRDLVPDGFINILDVTKVLPPVFGSTCP